MNLIIRPVRCRVDTAMRLRAATLEIKETSEKKKRTANRILLVDGLVCRHHSLNSAMREAHGDSEISGTDFSWMMAHSLGSVTGSQSEVGGMSVCWEYSTCGDVRRTAAGVGWAWLYRAVDGKMKLVRKETQKNMVD